MKLTVSFTHLFISVKVVSNKKKMNHVSEPEMRLTKNPNASIKMKYGKIDYAYDNKNTQDKR